MIKPIMAESFVESVFTNKNKPKTKLLSLPPKERFVYCAAMLQASLPEIVKFMVNNGATLRGGAIRDILCGNQVKDYDMYFYSEEELNSCMQKVAELVAKTENIDTALLTHPVFDSDYDSSVFSHLYEVTIQYNGVIVTCDLIVCEEINYEENLDFAINSAYYNGTTFGVSVKDPDLFFFSIDKKVLLFVGENVTTSRLAKRIYKMRNRGYVIFSSTDKNMLELLKLCEVI